MQCVLCNEEIEPQANGWAGGHNAQPLAEGQCCDACNFRVIKARLNQNRLYKQIVNPTWWEPKKC